MPLQCIKAASVKGLTQFGLLFYVHNPNDHYYDNAAEVRNYEVWVNALL